MNAAFTYLVFAPLISKTGRFTPAVPLPTLLEQAKSKMTSGAYFWYFAIASRSKHMQRFTRELTIFRVSKSSQTNHDNNKEGGGGGGVKTRD